MNGHIFQEQDGGMAFVGDFEGLYNSAPDPWDQSGQSGDMAHYYRHSRARLMKVLLTHDIDDAIEVGCGHGHLTAMIERVLPDGVIGMDCSQAAIEKAKELHPECDFIAGNLLAQDFKPPVLADAVIWAQILWYVLHGLDIAVSNTLRCIPTGGLFIISQAFLADQRYGREVIDGFQGAVMTFIGRYRGGLRLIESRYDDSGQFCHNDGLLVFRKL